MVTSHIPSLSPAIPWRPRFLEALIRRVGELLGLFRPRVGSSAIFLRIRLKEAFMTEIYSISDPEMCLQIHS